ncbi:MAG: response regulator [Gammaproteobacteria bacterium]|nr:response regulator [Gammaproteobacteria bacterium]
MSSTPFPSGRVLVIDDDHLACESVCAYLEDSGFEVLSAHSGRAGLDAVPEFKPHAVICDLRMPDLDGLEVIQQLLLTSPELPVIVLSGAGGIPDVIAALRLGACDYLVKPIVDLVNLELAIIKALDRREAGAESGQLALEAEHAELASHLGCLADNAQASRQIRIQLLPPPEDRISGLKFEHRLWSGPDYSGDFLDYFAIDARHSGFYMADMRHCASDHALTAMTLKSQFNALLRRLRDHGDDTVRQPELVLAELNQEVERMGLGRQLRLAYVVLVHDHSEIRYANAGYFPGPVLISNGDTIRAVSTLEESGLPLGAMTWARYASATCPLPRYFQLMMLSSGFFGAFDGESPAEKLRELVFHCEKNAIDLDAMSGLLSRSKSSDAAMLLVSRA